MTKFELISQAFKEGGFIPSQYTCRGQGVSPPLNIIGAPIGTKSMALIMHDPDAVGGDYTHWLVWDIPSSTDTIAAHSLPVGAIQGENSAGTTQYAGPCPPPGTGTHRYIFELYALNSTLGLPAGSKREKLEQAVISSMIEKTNLTGLFPSD